MNASDVLALVDSHFTLHVLAPGEEDLPHREDGEGEASPTGDAGAGGDVVSDAEATGSDQGPASSAFLPENLVEDFMDEVVEMLDQLEGEYADVPRWEKALVFGFVDGALAVADDSWSALEDSYFADASDPAYAQIDAAIDQMADEFEGERPWDEAAKGYVRSTLASLGEGATPTDESLWAPCAHAFFFGADAAYDLEWKFVITPAENLLVTDEDSISEAALAQMQAESGGVSLIDRVFDMMGIDIDMLAGAIEEAESEDAASVEAELLEVEDAPQPPQNKS